MKKSKQTICVGLAIVFSFVFFGSCSSPDLSDLPPITLSEMLNYFEDSGFDVRYINIATYLELRQNIDIRDMLEAIRLLDFVAIHGLDRVDAILVDLQTEERLDSARRNNDMIRRGLNRGTIVLVAMHNTAEIEQTFRDAIGGESAPIVALDYITIRGQDFDTTLTEFSVPIHFLRNSEIRQLRHMTDLTFLSLSPQQFDDLSPISGLTNLTGLDLGAYEGGQINDLSPIFGLTSLESLNLFNNNVSDTSSLSEFTSLTVLQMGRNGVNNLTGLYRTAQPLYEYV